MEIVNGNNERFWKEKSAVSLLKQKIGEEMRDGQILKIEKKEWGWKTEPYKMVYHMHARGWVDFTVSARTIEGGWLLKKIQK